MIGLRGLSRVVVGMLVLVAGLSGAGREVPVARAANAKPQTIPALREWTGGTGSFGFGATTRIVRGSADATALATTSQTFADDLRALTGFTVGQVTGAAMAGDIVLALGSSDTGLGAEGYALSVTDR